MAEVTTDRPHVIYLNTKEGEMEVYDDGKKRRAKAWKAWVIGFKYKTAEEGAQFGKELHVLLGEGNNVYDLGLLVKSGTFRGIMRSIQNTNLRQPITFRPWNYVDENSGKTKTGGINLEQGGRSISYKYTEKNPGDMPPHEMIPGEDGGEVKSFAKQTAWLSKILDEVIAPEVEHIAANGLYEDEVMTETFQIGPGLKLKELPAAEAAPTEAAIAGGPQPNSLGEMPLGSDMEGDTPF